MPLFREGAVVVVTGADGSIGKVIVTQLRDFGATVVPCDRGEPEPYNFDIRDRDGWNRMLDAVIEKHGRVDALINNAGVPAPTGDTVVDLDDDEWQRVLDININGARLGMSTTIARFGEDGGRIVNISSVAGHRPMRAMSAYATSKSAVLGMTHQAALDYTRRGVMINAIAPGMMKDVMREGRPSDVRDAVIEASVTGKAVQPGEIATGVEFLLDGRITSMVGSMMAIDAGAGEPSLTA